MNTIKKTNIFLKSFYVAVPIWLFLSINAYYLRGYSLALVTRILHIPGIILMLVVNPTWQQMHNYKFWHFLIGDFLFYYFLIVVCIALYRRKKRKHANRA